MYGMDPGHLGQLLEQTVQPLLIDMVMLHAFGLLRNLCDHPSELLRRMLTAGILQVFQRSDATTNAVGGSDSWSASTYRAAEHPGHRHRAEQPDLAKRRRRHGLRPGGG